MGLAGRLNSLIVQLTLPSGSEFGRMGQWSSIHPLDIRYRVVRLLDTWQQAGINYYQLLLLLIIIIIQIYLLIYF